MRGTERGQGFGIERGSGGLGARGRIGGSLKNPEVFFSKEERTRRKEEGGRRATY